MTDGPDRISLVEMFGRYALWNSEDHAPEEAVAQYVRADLAQATPRPMSEAPRDGTKVLAWWPSEYAQERCYVTTWCDVREDRREYWMCACDSAPCDSDLAPTHFLPHPEEPK